MCQGDCVTEATDVRRFSTTVLVLPDFLLDITKLLIVLRLDVEMQIPCFYCRFRSHAWSVYLCPTTVHSLSHVCKTKSPRFPGGPVCLLAVDIPVIGTIRSIPDGNVDSHLHDEDCRRDDQENRKVPQEKADDDVDEKTHRMCVGIG